MAGEFTSEALNGKPLYRIALYDRSRKRNEDRSEIVRRIPWNLVKYEQISAGESFEPIDAQKDNLTSYGDSAVPEITGIKFVDELTILNGSHGLAGHFGNDNW